MPKSRSSETFNPETRIITKTIYDENDNIVTVLKFSKDSSSRQKTDEILKKAREKYDWITFNNLK